MMINPKKIFIRFLWVNLFLIMIMDFELVAHLGPLVGSSLVLVKG